MTPNCTALRLTMEPIPFLKMLLYTDNIKLRMSANKLKMNNERTDMLLCGTTSTGVKLKPHSLITNFYLFVKELGKGLYRLTPCAELSPRLDKN